jgi:hypothetical protein
MRRYIRLIPLTIVILLLLLDVCPASNTQSYLFKNSVLKSQPTQYAPFLLSQHSQDSTAGKRVSSLRLKDPRMAVFYSFIPGIVFHGAGHIYAGKIGTGLLLFGSEIVGGGLLTIGAIGVAFSQDEYGESAWKPGYVLIATGTFLFLGSWFYDLIGSPLAVNKQNQILMQKKNTELKFQLKDKDLRLAIVWHF